MKIPNREVNIMNDRITPRMYEVILMLYISLLRIIIIRFVTEDFHNFTITFLE